MVVAVRDLVRLLSDTQESGIILLILCHRKGELSGEIPVPAKEICQRPAALTAGVIVHDNGVRVLLPLLHDDGTAGIEHSHDLLPLGFQTTDELHLRIVQPQTVAVAAAVFWLLLHLLAGAGEELALLLPVGAHADHGHVALGEGGAREDL